MTVSKKTQAASVAPVLGQRARKALAIRRGIIDATVALIKEIGFEKATITAIRKRTGISIATLYSYFPTKQSILLAILEDERESTGDAVQAALAADIDDPMAYLAGVVLAALIPDDFSVLDKVWREILAATIALSGEANVSNALLADRKSYTSHVLQGFERLISAGQIKPDTPYAVLCEVIYCISAHEFQDFVCGLYKDWQALISTLTEEFSAIVGPWIVRT